MDFTLLKILFAILCFQLLFVSFFLFQSKKGKTLSNRLLALVFLMMAISVSSLYWFAFGTHTIYPPLMFIDDTFMFAYGPILFLFTQSVLFKHYSLSSKNLLHLIPFFISVCLLIGIFIFGDAASMFETTKQLDDLDIPVYFRFGEMLILLYILYYLFKSKKALQRVLNKAYETYSAFNETEYTLLNFILNSFIILFLLSFIHSVLPFMGFNGGLTVTLILIVLFIFYFINSVLLKMLKLSTNDSGLITQKNFENKEKYAGSNLTQSQLAEYSSRIGDFMQTEKRFLDSNLNIDELSIELGLSSKILSQVINEGFSCNFFDFVNKMRIEEAKSLFSSQTDGKMTIQEIMYATGFNSKSSFNTAFKKFTRLTPTQFKNSL